MTTDSGITMPEALEEHFWNAASSGRIELQRCPSCGELRYFPKPVCPVCLSEDGLWEALSGNGRLYAATTVERAPSQVFAVEVPYTIALIDLDEGPRLMARLEFRAGDRPTAGAAVHFVGVGDSGLGPWLRFRVAESMASS